MKNTLNTHWETHLAIPFIVTLVFLVAGVCLYGQTTTATLSGVVRDALGGLVPEAKITLTNAATGASRTTTTDSDGRYNVTNLDPGTYELRVEHTGFKTAVQSAVVLTVGGSSSVDLAMQVGSRTDVVQVTQEEPLIETTGAELSRVVSEQSIESLPIIGRNFVDFAKLSSGVAPGRENIGGGAFKEPDTGVGSAAAPRLTFGGQSELSTNILVDGADNVQTFTGLPRATPSQEAVMEFRVLNSTYLAEYGRALGGFVNIVTKSGTNTYNGSLYYFGLNNALNARPILTGPNPVLRQNQYGFTFGGPLKKDKTFFFWNYEGQRRAESNKFSTVILNNVGPMDGSVPKTINTTKKFYGLTPENIGLLRTNDYDGFLVKLDHRFTANNSFSVRYNLLDSITRGFLGGGGRASPAPSTARNNKTFDQAIVASDTTLLGTTLVNELRLQWSRRSFDFPSVFKDPDLEVSNLLITGKSTSDVDFYRESRAEASESLSFILGRHHTKVGADFNNLNDASQWDLFFPARVIFGNLNNFLAIGTPSGSPLPAVFWFPLLNPLLNNGATARPVFAIPFAQDVPTAYQSFVRTGLTHNAYGFFAQDEWKATQKLTLTYGLRYDLETYPAKFVQRTDRNNFQPRVGFAYAFSPRTVVRAGFGIFDDRLVSSIGQTFDTAEWLSAGYLPNASVLFPGVSPSQARFLQPTVGGPGAPPATKNFTTTGVSPTPATIPGCIPSQSSGPCINPGFTDNLDGGLRTPYAEQASLKIAHEFGGGIALSVSYLYVHGLKIEAHTGNLNGVQTGVTPFGTPSYAGPGGRRFPELGDFYVKDSGGFSVYHGGTLEIEKRFAHGISFHGSYTFSKVINNSESVANLADIPQAQDRRLERAVSRQSVPHRFTLVFVSEIPQGVRVLHAFKFSSLISVESGRFFNIFAGSDVNGDGNPLSDRPGLAPGSPTCPPAPAACPLGRDTLEGPDFATWDLRVARDVHFSERLRAEFSADLFNLLNRTNIKDLNTVWGAPLLSTATTPILGFGTPRDAFNPFQFQFGFKLRF
jgi:hypothetical protein